MSLLKRLFGSKVGARPKTEVELQREKKELRDKFHLHVHARDVGIVRKLLKKGGIDVNSLDDGKSALMRTLDRARIDAHCTKMVQVLVEHGIDIHFAYPGDWMYKKGTTAMYLAAQNGMLGAVKIFLDHGVDPNQKIADSYPIVLASKNYSDRGKHIEIVKLLVERGADINVKNDDGATALIAICDHHLIADGHDPKFVSMRRVTELVPFLLESRADVDLKDHDGNTATHHAVNNGNHLVLEKLLQHGARTDIKNKSGKTAHMVAQKPYRNAENKDLVLSMLKEMSRF